MGIGNQHEAQLEAGSPVRRGEGVVLGAQQEAGFDGQRIGADGSAGEGEAAKPFQTGRAAS